jgi:hypothetical protein
MFPAEWSDRESPFFAGANANRFFNGGDEDFAISDFAGLGGVDNGADHSRNFGVGQDEVYLQLGQEIGTAALMAAPFDVGQRHSFDVEFVQGVSDILQPEGFDDGLYPFHAKISRRLIKRKTRAPESDKMAQCTVSQRIAGEHPGAQILVNRPVP